MPIQAGMVGERLAYVVVPVGKRLTRYHTHMVKGEGLKHVPYSAPGGFMVYFPRGHVLRMSAKALREYHLTRDAKVVSLDKMFSKRSALYRMLQAQDEPTRAENFQRTFTDLQKLGIRLATAKTGPMLLDENPDPPMYAPDDGQYTVDPTEDGNESAEASGEAGEQSEPVIPAPSRRRKEVTT